MYRGFVIDSVSFDNGSNYDIGSAIFNSCKTEIKSSLDEFANSDGSALDGSLIQENWFPTGEKFDVFISHSHRDERNAIALAGYLQNHFGLTAFIDSAIWGYSEDLLRKIDDKYCYQTESKTFSYRKRNGSTSHIHMMLVNALTAMMDNCECLMFLGTPNSISFEETSSKTKSPWIYTELGISKYLRRNEPGRGEIAKSLIYENRLFSAQPLTISYKLDLDHLDLIDANVFKEWRKSRQFLHDRHVHCLDDLYELVPKT